MMRDNPDASPDRRLPLLLLLSIMIQTCGAFIWAGAIDQRIGHVEAEVAAQAEMPERTTRLEEQLAHIRNALERIERKLETRTP